jgi:signal transduction histidine kinase
VVRSQIASGKLRVAFALSEPDPEIRCNAAELEQVFVNLLTNAAQAHPRTCHVVIRSQLKPDELRVFVSDDGPGIAAADVARIFEPFFSTHRKSGGTGLGLSITQRIVANHGGTISVSTAPGRGATFELRFPRET